MANQVASPGGLPGRTRFQSAPPSRLEKRADQLQGEGGGWVAVTLARVTLDVHVRALTRGNVAGLYIRVALAGSSALGTARNAVPESAAHLLPLCTCLVPTQGLPPLTPHLLLPASTYPPLSAHPESCRPSAEGWLESVREESIYNVCFITSP